MKKIFAWFLAVMLLAPALSWSAVETGNLVCPVSGDEVAKGDKAVFAEYNGKKYALCCKMCLRDFKKDPEKFAAAAEEQMKTQAVPSETEHAGHAH